MCVLYMGGRAQGILETFPACVSVPGIPQGQPSCQRGLHNMPKSIVFMLNKVMNREGMASLREAEAERDATVAAVVTTKQKRRQLQLSGCIYISFQLIFLPFFPALLAPPKKLKMTFRYHVSISFSLAYASPRSVLFRVCF